jgi:hypothetical protein
MAEAVALSAKTSYFFLDVPGSNLNRDTVYSDLDLSCLFSVPAGKFRDDI